MGYLLKQQNIVNQWLVELGYNPDGFKFDFEKQEITPKDNPHWNPDYHKSTGAVEDDRGRIYMNYIFTLPYDPSKYTVVENSLQIAFKTR